MKSSNKRRVQYHNTISLAGRFKYLLEVTGFSQEQLGERIGLSGKSVGRIENGETKRTKAVVLEKFRALESQYDPANSTNSLSAQVSTANSSFTLADASRLYGEDEQLVTRRLKAIINCYPLLSKIEQNAVFKQVILGLDKK